MNESFLEAISVKRELSVLFNRALTEGRYFTQDEEDKALDLLAEFGEYSKEVWKLFLDDYINKKDYLQEHDFYRVYLAISLMIGLTKRNPDLQQAFLDLDVAYQLNNWVTAFVVEFADAYAKQEGAAPGAVLKYLKEYPR